jgi:hypothetical protein
MHARGPRLVGANHVAQATDGNDGLLTALEISGMDGNGRRSSCREDML